jgi:hypothetical protein
MLQGRPHRFIYGYNSVFSTPQIGIAKVRLCPAAAY